MAVAARMVLKRRETDNEDAAEDDGQLNGGIDLDLDDDGNISVAEIKSFKGVRVVFASLPVFRGRRAG
jgi:hypothetical protein